MAETMLTWNLVTNFDLPTMPGATAIFVPKPGVLFVNYSYQDGRAAKRIYVQHKDSTTQINPGANSVQVFAGDSLVYQLFESNSDQIKISFQVE